MAPAHPCGYVKVRCFGGLKRGSEAQNWKKIGAEGIFSDDDDDDDDDMIIIIIILYDHRARGVLRNTRRFRTTTTTKGEGPRR